MINPYDFLSNFSLHFQYQIESLKSICGAYLCANLTVENVATVLLLADMHNLGNLKHHCTKFVRANVDDMLTTDGWKSLVESHTKIACLFLQDVLKDSMNNFANLNDSNGQKRARLN